MLLVARTQSASSRSAARLRLPLAPRRRAVAMRHAGGGDGRGPGGSEETLAERASRVYAQLEPMQMLYVQVVYLFLVVSASIVGAANALRLLKFYELYPFW
jgi:hypothetical protein